MFVVGYASFVILVEVDVGQAVSEGVAATGDQAAFGLGLGCFGRFGLDWDWLMRVWALERGDELVCVNEEK